jgi:glutamate 5-kinase
MSEARQSLAQAKRWVIKIGSALLTNDGKGLHREAIAGWVEQIAKAHQSGKEIILVSSGSVAEGMTRLGWSQRPHEVHKLQAAAAVGQMGLIQAYEGFFQQYGLHAAQVLLVHDDLSHRQRYLNARSTLRTLMGLNVIPIVNENDTVATDEIRFGDNDSLAGLVANLVEADALLILTDQDGMFDADPRGNPAAKLIDEARAGDERLYAMAGGSAGALGRGGMLTKVKAARLAARSGTSTVIAGGRLDQVVTRALAGMSVGTLLCAEKKPLAARKQWLAGQLQTRGELVVDDGAARVLRQSGKSLLPVGVVSVSGRFQRGEVVRCLDLSGLEIARGLANYSAEESIKIAGVASSGLEAILGYQGDEELIHRDNMVLS